MKLVPQRRPTLLSVRRPLARADEFDDEPFSFLPHTTPCAMHRRGGMTRDEREEILAVFRAGSRIREPVPQADDPCDDPGPSARPFVLCPPADDPAVRVAGFPRLRLRVDRAGRGQAYRVLEPGSTRFRMRATSQDLPPADPRFRFAGRGGPKFRFGS